MTGRLAGKTAMITGAAHGIGRATAERFLLEGAQVWAVDRDAEALAMLNGCVPRRVDICDAQAVEALIAEAPPLDILFNCAGMVAAGTILDCSEQDWQASFDLNVTAMYRLIRAALPKMLANGGSSIVNMASVASTITGVPNRFAYGASKAAVIGLTKAVAADYVAQGIRCNAICPGTVDTPALHERLRATGDYDNALRAFNARQPMGRLGKADEIAALALYLGSDDSAFTTGQIHVIDGGWTV
ncbi:SDR family oxidoreductase [Sphingomonas sp. LM7]|uniref:SDR family oxidoreductase n=1 Tax=Sphingomonas sp. LM7 TaxID=1938607 RepID=UPI000983F414|nr:SDR family oxidoreductase [Sphingomonas sp. LM7]AQR73450.1 NAD(P)-dependent oxidoreductase [Sphingomonas sp. LM7]